MLLGAAACSSVSRPCWAAESGWLTILELHDRTMRVVARDHLTDGAHVAAVHPTSHHDYVPVPDGGTGQPAVLDDAPD